MKKAKALYATIVVLVTLTGIIMMPVATMAQDIDVLAPPTQTEAIQTQDKDLGLSELKLGENPWVSVISRNDVGMTYAAHLSRAGLGLGPDTKALLGEIRDAEIRTSSEVSKWMEPSLRMIEGRIKDTNWRHEFSTGGPATTSTTKRAKRLTATAKTSWDRMEERLTSRSMTRQYVGAAIAPNAAANRIPKFSKPLLLPPNGV